MKFNEQKGIVDERFPAGYLIYYNKPGKSAEEFIYFLDILSGYQILDGEQKIRIKFAHAESAQDIKSNFDRAIQLYIREWGSDQYKFKKLKEIEADVVSLSKYSFSRVQLAWERA